jgi:catalase
LRDHDMQWDFWTLSPESAHQVTWLMGDRGLPSSWRHMDGFGSHTYQWINAAGERFWVKYHFTTDQGVEILSQEQADQIAGEDADFHIRDLSSAIDRGDFPSWTLSVQVMPYEDAKSYRFNPFDLTKVWPHADYPLIEVGTMTLDRNPENYFAQIEQAAFAPSNFVPGIAASPDKMLLARIFSYADAHRYRVGTNHAQLPVNAPKSPVHSYSKDGPMRFDFQKSEVPVYAPNTMGGAHADPARAAESAGWETDGELTRAAATLHPEDDDFGQAGTLYREVLDDDARARLVANIAGHVSKVTRPELRQRVLQYWANVDSSLSQRVAEALAPSAPGADVSPEAVGIGA